MKTIKDIEAELALRLIGPVRDLNLLPDGFELKVRLHGKARDKKRTALFEKNWSPETDSIHISLRPAQEHIEARPQVEEERSPGAHAAADDSSRLNASARTAGQAPVGPGTPAPTVPPATDSVFDLIRALDRAELRPGYRFIALKWFRDTALPAEGFSWAKDPSATHRILRDVIDKRLILTSKEPNPKSPEYPVTAIRLNRLMPEVRAALGRGDAPKLDFQPVPILGEGLSDTVLRDRR